MSAASPESIARLRSRLADVHQMHMAAALMDWDQQTNMPPDGVGARAEQKATLSRLTHDLLTSDETGALLVAAEKGSRELDPASGDAALVRMARRDYDQATALPASLVEEKARVTALAQEEWAAARAEDNYERFAPWLERVIDLQRATANALGYDDRLYDALLDQYEPGMTSARLDVLFKELRNGLAPLVRRIEARSERASDSVLHREFNVEVQRECGEEVLGACGFDLRRGRLDQAVHPFCTHFSQNDVRLTTRYDPGFFSGAFFGTLHEMGHGLYEQNISPEYEGSLLSSGCSLGFHESQSRLWENLVGRSRHFWTWYFPRLQQRFPRATAGVTPDEWYRAINRVAPSLIRVEADEITYNLHIVLRYELENELLERRLSVADAPEAWRDRMKDLLGIQPLNEREGILQDVHWSIGIMGYFPTYSLGNLLSVQIYNRALEDLPGIPAGIEKGRFAPLLDWLRENVLRHGRSMLPDELCEKVTGQPLGTGGYIAYLERKYGEIYGL